MKLRHSPVPLVATLTLAACGGGTPPGAVDPGEVIVQSGDVNPNYLVSKLSEAVPMMEMCYATALRSDMNTSGLMVFDLEGEGAVITPTIAANETGDDSLAACAQRAVSGLALSDSEPGMPWEFSASWALEFERGQPETTEAAY